MHLKANECNDLKVYSPLYANAHIICDATLNVLHGYSSKKKTPVWSVYNVAKKPYENYTVNTGSHKKTIKLKNEQQVDLNLFDVSGLDKAYLVAPYQIIKHESDVEDAFTTLNTIAVPNKLWRGPLNDLLFNTDLLERKMFNDKGEIIAIYGAVPGAVIGGVTTTKYLYRIYYQKQFDLTLAFMFPVSNDVTTNPEDYLTNVACIEEIGDVTFFSNFDPFVQKDIKNRKAISAVKWARRDGNITEKKCENY